VSALTTVLRYTMPQSRRRGSRRVVVGSNWQTEGSSNDILILKQALHRLSKRLVFIETFLKDKFRMFSTIVFVLLTWPSLLSY
jgi:hypothetical protein